MPPKKRAVPPEVLQLKITLLGTTPPIWRRVLVPADLTLAGVARRAAGNDGWQECHMHEFNAGHRHFAKPNQEGLASKIPALSVKQMPRDWESRYGFRGCALHLRSRRARLRPDREPPDLSVLDQHVSVLLVSNSLGTAPFTKQLEAHAEFPACPLGCEGCSGGDQESRPRLWGR